MLKCQLCDYEHEFMIAPTHIKKHGFTSAEYKEKFPNAVLRIQTEEAKLKIKNSKTGKISVRRGIPISEEQKQKQSMSMKLAFASGKLKHWNTGKKHSEETKEKIQKSCANYHLTPEQSIKHNQALQKFKNSDTYVPPMLGKKHSIETKEKISNAIKGDKNWMNKAFNEKLNIICTIENLKFLSREQSRLTFKCNTCDYEFAFGIGYFTKSAQYNGNAKNENICPSCYPRTKNKSIKELELLEFIKQHYSGEIKSGSRTIIFPYELDIFIPEKNIAIEFNGIYWHCENVGKQNRVSKFREYEKHQMCQSEGIQLISIFEDEWDNQQEIVKQRLLHILKIKQNVKNVFARKCEIKEISKQEKDDFLNKFHIQRTDKAKISLGAFYEGNLVSVMTFMATTFVKGGDGTFTELSRFAINFDFTCVGIASRFISFYKKCFNDNKPLISYSDNRWSNGNVYKTIGFEQISSSKPGYFYIDLKISNKQRIHRSNFMKHRLVKIFKNDETVKQMILYNKSEWEIMQFMGYDRIWDCGTTKWLLK